MIWNWIFFLSALSYAQRTDDFVKLNNGIMMPKVAVGTWQYNASVAFDTVTKALNLGYVHVDTAHDYDNQVGVGKAINTYLSLNSKKREDLFITSKVPGCEVDGASWDNCGQDTYDLLKEDLQQLDLKYLDMVLIHFPPMGAHKGIGCGADNCEKMRDQWKMLQRGVAEGIVRSIGVSNFCVACLRCILEWEETKIVPVVNQVQMHLGMGPRKDVKLLTFYHRKHEIVTQAYSPLGNNNAAIFHDEVAVKIANFFNKTPAQVALKWLIDSDVAFASKSTNEVHLKDNLDMFGWNLGKNELTALGMVNEPDSSPSFACHD